PVLWIARVRRPDFIALLLRLTCRRRTPPPPEARAIPLTSRSGMPAKCCPAAGISFSLIWAGRIRDHLIGDCRSSLDAKSLSPLKAVQHLREPAHSGPIDSFAGSHQRDIMRAARVR